MNYLPLPPFEHKIFYTDNNIRFVRATIGDQVYQMTTRWELNRPADQLRVKEINETIQKQKRIDGPIYLACIIRNGLVQWVCYEGNHRREALEGMTISVDVQILYTQNEQDIIDHFTQLNKSIPVPSLYYDGRQNEKKSIFIHDIVKILSLKYPNNQSKSRKPNKGKFNRDILIDLIDEGINDVNIDFDLQKTIFTDWIDELNLQLKQSVLDDKNFRILRKKDKIKVKAPSPKQVENAIKKDCFIFILGMEYFVQKLRNNLQQIQKQQIDQQNKKDFDIFEEFFENEDIESNSKS